MESTYKDIKFTDADIVNPDDFIPAAGENGRTYNPHNVRPRLIHDHGFTVAVVFASNLQDALDEAGDADKLDHFMIDPKDDSDRADYMTMDVSKMAAGFDEECVEYTHSDGTKWWWKMEPTFLGNAGEPFDIEGLGVIELPNPKFSFCALFNAQFDNKLVRSHNSTHHGNLSHADCPLCEVEVHGPNSENTY